MSVRVLALVWDGFRGGGSELLAMLALADWCDDEGHCYPAMAAIATKTRLSRSQAQRVVHSLVDAGDVVVIGNANGGAPGSSRRYRIALERLTGRTDAAPTGRVHATGRTDATGRMGAQEGPHGCGERGRMDATLTVIEPSVTVIPSSAKPPKLPICPYSEIVKAYHEALPELPRVLALNQKRKDGIAKFWRRVLIDTRPDTGERRATNASDALQWIRRYFEVARGIDWMMGRGQRSAEHARWKADIDYLVSERAWPKVIDASGSSVSEAS
jgi:hypothetical protein